MVLFVGRFTGVKGIPTLIRAHARAREALGRPLPLVLWGGAPGEWEGEHPSDAAAASPWGDEVFLAGWGGHDQLPGALAAADVLAVPSAGERFGLVYVEAMAMGVPPIAGDAGAPPTFIDADPASPTRSGWLVPPGDEAALAAALVDAAADPAERALRGANGRRLARRRFGWPGIARRVVGIYAAAAVPAGEPARGANASAVAIGRPPGTSTPSASRGRLRRRAAVDQGRRAAAVEVEARRRAPAPPSAPRARPA